MNKHSLLILLLFIATNFSILKAQSSRIDSLQNLLSNHEEDTSKVLLYLELGFAYERHSNEVLINDQKALKLANKLNYQRGKAKSMVKLGDYYSDKADYEQAFDFYEKALKIAKKIDDKDLLSGCYTGMGILYDTQGKYIQALDYYQKNLTICQEIGQKYGIVASLTNIGNIHATQGENDKALEYFERNLKLTIAMDYKPATAVCLVNIGDLHEQKGEYDKAIQNIEEALAQGYKTLDPYCFEGLGGLYQKKKEYQKALSYYQKALKGYQKFEDEYGICTASIGLSEFYLETKEYKKSLTYVKKGLEIAEKLELLSEAKDAHELLSNIYLRTKNYQKAYLHQAKFRILNDSLFNDKNVKELAGVEYQYKHEKEKQAIALAQAKKDAIQEAEAKEQSKIRNLLILGVVLAILLVLIAVYGFFQKQKANKILAKQKIKIETANEELNQINEELNTTLEKVNQQTEEIQSTNEELKITVETVNQQKEEILSTNEELNITLETVNEQKTAIEKIHQKTQASINYASRIQQALLPSQKLFSAFFTENFILFKPKDIVSGDFYYLKKINDFLVIAVADCTGHGVPGAFVSLLGISFLNEIIAKKEVKTAAQVLEELRIQVKTSLKQNEQDNQSKDGMDIALCVLDTKTNLMQFAGAYNPLYVVRDKRLIEVKGTKNPIGVHLKETNFENHEIQLQKEDSIYLFSDGYIDQFGGEKGMKFMSKRFKELLIEIDHEPCNYQKEILETTLQNWQGREKQIDDITILGFKI